MSVPKPKTRTKSKAWKDLAITFVVAAVVFILAVQFDSFEKFAAWSARYNSWQVNEVAAVLVFLAFAFAIFSWRRWKELKAEINRRREYRDLFQLANDPILIFDAADATVLDVNDKACEVYGITREEFIGRKLEEIAHDPSDARRRLEQVRTDGKVQNFETSHIRGDGSLVHLLINRSLIRYLGREAILSIDRDVTQGKRAEEALLRAEQKYREIFENVGEGIFQTTPEGRFITANPALARMLGFDSPAELITARKDIARDHYVDPQRREEFKARLDAQGLVKDFELEAYRKDGSRIWTTVNVRAVRDQGGSVIYYEGISQDITGRKRAEAISAAFASLARKLSGARTQLDAGLIIAVTAKELFGWDACNIDLYDVDRDLICPMLNVDTIDGERVEVTPAALTMKPTARARCVLERGPELRLREEPIQFDPDSVPFGDTSRPSASLMTVPVRHASKIVGLLSIQSYTPHSYDNRALKDLEALADHCGEALNRIRAEESLHESEERYRDLVENSHELICTHDLDGLILSANRAAAVALGYDLDGFVGKRNIRDILAPEVRDQFDEYMARLRKDGGNGGLMLVQTNSGERRVWEYYNSLRTEGVDTPIVRGMARDITDQRLAEKALRESEERYRELFENAHDAIYVHDLNGRYTSVNRAAENLSGYQREEIIGRHFSNFIAPSHLRYARENLCRKLDQQAETTYEAEIVSKTGRRTPVEISSRLVYENGLPVGVQGTARDISERKQTQEALRLYSRALIDAQETERQRIARELHDEIGQVLTAVRINLQTAKTARNAAEAANHIEDSIRVTDEALRQVRDLSLDLRPPHLDDFGLATALRWFIDRFSQRTGIVAKFETTDDEQRLARETETACFRIAQEALTNVARHAKAKRVSVKLKRNRDQLFLIVKDDGVGFDVNALGHSTPVALGLRGMKERASAVRGRIDIDSADGKGTQVRVRFPVV